MNLLLTDEEIAGAVIDYIESAQHIPTVKDYCRLTAQAQLRRVVECLEEEEMECHRSRSNLGHIDAGVYHDDCYLCQLRKAAGME